MTYKKIGFQDRIDSKPTTYLVDGKPLEITKDNSGLVKKGSSLNADNLNHLEDGIHQNSVEIERFNTELLTNKTKTVKENSNVISLKDNVEGIANVTVGGNTIDVNKEPIVSDFKNKISGSTSKNPNIFKIGFSDKLLQIYDKEFTEKPQEDYNKIYSLDGLNSSSSTSVNKKFPQMLFSFNLIKIVETEKGQVPGDSIKEKVNWLKNNIKNLTCKWYGYGECPRGNKAYLDAFDIKYNRWNMKYQNLQNSMANSSNKPSVLAYSTKYISDYLTDDGCIIFVAYTDASDGKTPSVIYTDYVNLEVQLATKLQSVGEKEKEIEIKSVGKNLFNPKNLTSVYSNRGKIEYVNNGFKIFSKSHYYKRVKVKPNTDYCLSYSLKLSKPTITGESWVGDDKLFGSIFQWNNKNKKKFNSGLLTDINISFVLWDGNDGDFAEYTDIQLEECSDYTPYEPYKEDKINIQLKEPLRRLSSGVRDTLHTDGTILRRIGNITLNGDEDWHSKNSESLIQSGWNQFGDSLIFALEIDNPIVQTFARDSTILSNLKVVQVATQNEQGISFECGTGWQYLAIRIEKTNLRTQDVEGFKKWLKENPVTVYYELKEPVIENIGQPLSLKTFKGGHIVTDTDIAPYITVDYPTNVSSRITGLESAEVSLKNSLGGAWKTLLMLADKELQMKSIKLLETENVTDIKGKINEIIGVWKDEHI